MDDTSAFERAIFNWFSRHGYRVAALAPLAVFLILLIVGATLVIAALHRTLDSYTTWLFVVSVFAALGLYVTEIYALFGLSSGSRRLKLLELHQTMRDIRDMGWRQFEALIVAYYEERGYDVEHTGRDHADGGVDLSPRKMERPGWFSASTGATIGSANGRFASCWGL